MLSDLTRGVPNPRISIFYQISLGVECLCDEMCFPVTMCVCFLTRCVYLAMCVCGAFVCTTQTMGAFLFLHPDHGWRSRGGAGGFEGSGPPGIWVSHRLCKGLVLSCQRNPAGSLLYREEISSPGPAIRCNVVPMEDVIIR